MKKIYESNKGITLISLVVTIIILLILATVTISQIFHSGMINKAEESADKQEKEVAIETINFKITSIQISKYIEKQVMPTLKELADEFCKDNDFQYVLETSKIASLDKIENENPEFIYAKLKAYPYEFQINNALQLISVDGIKLAETNNNDKVTISKEEYQQLMGYKEQKENMETQLSKVESEKATLQTQLTDLTNEKSILQAQVESLTNEKTTLESQIKELQKVGKDWTLVLSFVTSLGWNGGYQYGSASGTITVKSVNGEISISQTGGTKASGTENWNGSYYINARTTSFTVVSFTIN